MDPGFAVAGKHSTYMYYTTYIYTTYPVVVGLSVEVVTSKTHRDSSVRVGADHLECKGCGGEVWHIISHHIICFGEELGFNASLWHLEDSAHIARWMYLCLEPSYGP